MVRKGRLAKGLGDHGVGIVGVPLDARAKLRAHAVNDVLIEAGAVQRQLEELERLVDIARQRLQMARHGIPIGSETDMDGEILDGAMKGARVVGPAPSSSKPANIVASPSLPSGSWRAAAPNRNFERHQWHGVALDEPRLDAAGRDHSLDVFRPGLGRLKIL